jgi:hypothetical protein
VYFGLFRPPLAIYIPTRAVRKKVFDRLGAHYYYYKKIKPFEGGKIKGGDTVLKVKRVKGWKKDSWDQKGDRI